MTHGAAQASYHSRDMGFGRRSSYITHKNNNPFVGPVDEQIFVGDVEGNIIPVPAGHQLAGSKDGKCIQQKDGDGKATGLRKDGKGHPLSPVHKDPRSLNPRGHVPGITNSDGTPWLSIY